VSRSDQSTDASKLTRPLLLDLFCCEGGAAVGYHRAGFEVVGVDIDPQPRYPFEFIRADALTFLERMVAGGTYEWKGPGLFAAVHASPPCQAHSDLQKQSRRDYPDLIAPVRALLREWARRRGIPYVIENVEGAPLIDPVKVCGASISGLRVIRHRLFESNVPLAGVPCPAKHPLVFTHDKRKAHYGQLDQDTSYVQVTGGGNATIANKRAAMGTPWMSGHGCNEAIPPVYTELIGRQLLNHLSKLTPIESEAA
jgi:DNA (cytosine-5)-methyltransferase 1